MVQNFGLAIVQITQLHVAHLGSIPIICQCGSPYLVFGEIFSSITSCCVDIDFNQ